MCSSAGGLGPQAAQEAVGLLQQLAQQRAASEGLVAAGAVAALSHHLGPAEGSLIQDRALQGLLLLCQASPSACEQAVQAGCIEAAFAHVPQVGPCKALLPRCQCQPLVGLLFGGTIQLYQKAQWPCLGWYQACTHPGWDKPRTSHLGQSRQMISECKLLGGKPSNRTSSYTV